MPRPHRVFLRAFGASFGPDSLTVGYSSTDSEFQISGTATMSAGTGFSATGSLGTGGAPGLLIDDSGDVTSLDLSVTSSMSVAGLSVTAAGVTIAYQAGGSPTSGIFEIVSGSVTVGSSGSPVTFGGTFGSGGTPGLVLTGDTVTSMDIAVTSSMTIDDLGVTASGVQFVYSAGTSPTQGIFEIASGAVTVSTNGSAFYFQGVFGSPAAGSTPAIPGLMMTGSTLSSVDITVSSSMSVSGMSLTVSDLQFEYVNDSSSIYNGDFEIVAGGSVSFSTSAGDTTFAATFGNNGNPGLIIQNGVLTELYATITSTINAQGLILSVNDLAFQYVSAGDYFEVYSGAVAISSGDVQFASASFVQVTTGNVTYPGLEISNGVLEVLDIKIDSNLSVSGMTLTISNLQFDYQSVVGQTYGNFEITAGGSVSLSAGASNTLSFSGTFGTGAGPTATPGLSISDGVLESFYISISSNISLGGLTLTVSNLAFSYDESSEIFEIPSGSVSVTDSNGDFSFTGTFGTTATTNNNGIGLVVDGDSSDSTYGSLTELNVTVTSQFVAGGVTFAVGGLAFYYDSSGDQYEIDTGSISFDTSEGFSFSATFGLPSPTNSAVTLPGLVIVNGTLTQFNAALTTSFTVAGLVIDVNDVAMNYSADEFAMYGTVTVNTTNISFTGQIGDPSTQTYGLFIDNNVLESLAITITSTVSFGGLTMTAAPLAFNYSASPEEFTLYGNVSVSAAGVNVTGNLGNATLPGLTIVNGALTELNLGVSANFTLFGLACDVQALTFQYFTSGGTTEYIMFGSLTLSVGQPGSSGSAQGKRSPRRWVTRPIPE